MDVQQTNDNTKVKSRNSSDLSIPAIVTVCDQKIARRADAATASTWMQWMARRSFKRPGAQWCVMVTAIGPRFPNAINTERYAGRFHPKTRKLPIIS